MLGVMSPAASPPKRLEEARELVREKGLSPEDLVLLEEIFKAAEGELRPLTVRLPEEAARPQALPALQREFGLFLAFLNRFSDKRLGETRTAMGLVLQHSLARMADLAAAAHRENLDLHQDPVWVVNLLEVIASLRTMATALGKEGEPWLRAQWGTYLHDRRDTFRELFTHLARQEGGPERVAKLNAHMKTLNRTLQGGGAMRPMEAIHRLRDLLESGVPPETRARVEPLILVEQVIANLKHTLVRPLDRGIHWPALDQMRGSLQWLWNHLGWTMPRLGEVGLHRALPPEVRRLLKELKQNHPPAFLIVARALASHLALLGLVDGMRPAATLSPAERYAAVPTFMVLEGELGRLAEGVYHPRAAEGLPANHEDALLLGAFLRQAVLALLQDQSTVKGLLQQALATEDADHLAHTLDNLRAMLLNHQRQLMGDLAGLFSPELRQKLFPDSPSLTEEGDRLRQRLHRLWEYLTPVANQLRIHLELQSWARLALALAQAQAQVANFRRSPEFLLIRTQDRTEFDRLTLSLSQLLDNPADIEPALVEGLELIGDLTRFMELFLLRINARIPLIRHDLTLALEGAKLSRQLQVAPRDLGDRTRMTHKLIQTTKRLGVRDPQALMLLKRWVRLERNGKEVQPSLESLASHLDHLAMRLEAALS